MLLHTSYKSPHSFTNINTKRIIECDQNYYFFFLDEDECAVDSPCSHSCNNIMGGFSCACPSGFTISTESNTCQGQIYINHKFSNLYQTLSQIHLKHISFKRCSSSIHNKLYKQHLYCLNLKLE